MTRMTYIKNIILSCSLIFMVNVVKAQDPGWTVTGIYAYDQSVTFRLSVACEYLVAGSKVYAFEAGEVTKDNTTLRGVATVNNYNAASGGFYYGELTVESNVSTAEDIEFWIYNQSTGGPIVKAVTILPFEADGNYGNASNPVDIITNNAPTDIILSNNVINENAGAAAAVGVLSEVGGDDYAPAGFKFYLATGNNDTDNSSFTVAVGTGQVTTNAGFNYEDKSLYNIRVQVQDDDGCTIEKAFEINVTDVNEAPTSVTLNNYYLDENQPINTVIAGITTNDVDNGDSFTYSIVPGQDADSVSLFPNNVLISNEIVDFEKTDGLQFVLRSTDAGGNTRDENITILINDLNEAPTDITIDVSTVEENVSIGTTVGLFFALDQDASETETYELVSVVGSDNENFIIVGNELKTNVLLDFEDQVSHYIYVKVTDKGGLTKTKQFTITVTNKNEAPTNIALSNNAFEEYDTAGSIDIGDFATVDEDAGDTFTYDLVSGTGDDDNDSFKITGNTLQTSGLATFDYTQQQLYTIRVEATDNGTPGLKTIKTFEIEVESTNNVPTNITLSEVSYDENQTIGSVIANVVVTDADGSDNHVISFDNSIGNDNAWFNIVGAQLRSKTVFNYEEQSTFYLNLTATDNHGASVSKQVLIDVNDVNEAPTDISLSNNLFDESDSGTPIYIGDFTTNDVDNTSNFAYTLIAGIGSTDNANFEISGNVLSSKTGVTFDVTEKSEYQIRVQVNDNNTSGLTFEKTFTLNVESTNAAPTDISFSTVNFDENQEVGSVLATIDVTDADNANHTLEFVNSFGNNNESFTLINGQIRSNEIFDFETKKTYYVFIKATDNHGASFTKALAIDITDANDIPSDLDLSNNSIPENISAGTVVGLFSTTDEDAGDSFDYALISGEGEEGNAMFDISGNSLITNTTAFDFLEQKSYSIRVRSKDAAGYDVEKIFTINITSTNENPTGIVLTPVSLSENQVIGSTIGTLSAIDSDNNTHDFEFLTVAGNDNASFSLVDNALKSNIVFDYETKNIYYVNIKATDDHGASVSRQLVINIEDENDGPSAIWLSNNVINENVAIGTSIGGLSTTDEDGSDTHMYALISGIGGEHNSAFVIDNDTLRTNSSFDYLTQNEYNVLIESTDGAGAKTTKGFVINIWNNNTAPLNVIIDNQTIQENSDEGTLVGTLDVNDADITDTHTYQFDNTTVNDNSLFTLVDDKLFSNTSFDFETKSIYYVFIKATDNHGTSVTTQFVIEVTEGNDVPSDILLSNTSVNENVSLETVVGSFTTIDQDGTDSYTYTLVSGMGDTDNAKFDISGGNLITNAALDYNLQQSFSILVSSTDFDGASVNKNFTISLNDVNEAPTGISLSNNEVFENSTITSVIGNCLTTDPDDGDTFTYSLANQTGDNGMVSITPSGLLKVNGNYNYESQSVLTIDIVSTDAAGLSFEQALNVNILNANDAPTNISLDTNTVMENLSVGALVGSMTTMDEDLTDTFTYAFQDIAGNDNGFFTIVDNQILTNDIFDFEIKKDYYIYVTSTDENGKSITKQLAIQINDGFDTPTDITLSNNMFEEAAEVNTVVGVFNAMDQDEGETFTYNLVSGIGDEDNALFTISNDTLYTDGTYNVNIHASHQILVQVTDFNGEIFKKSFELIVLNSNNTPTNITMDNVSVNENMAIGTVVGTLSSLDVDLTDTHTYSLVAGTGGEDNNLFIIQGNELKTNVKFDFEQDSLFSVLVQTMDLEGAVFAKSFEIVVNDMNDPSTDIFTSTVNFDENLEIGSSILTFSTEDQDVDDQFTYYFDNSQSSNNDLFVIDNDTLITNSNFNFESKALYVIRVTSEDEANNKVTRQFILDVNDVNDLPTNISLSSSVLEENNLSNILVGILSTTDEDADEYFMYDFQSGAAGVDNNLFSISNDSVYFQGAADFETKAAYQIQVSCTDHGGAKMVKSYQINVSDVNDVPIMISLSNTSITENNLFGAVVATINTSDQDVNDAFSYQFVNGDNDNMFFAIMDNQLELMVEADYETKDSYEIEIESTDKGGESIQQLFVIQIVNVNEAPMLDAQAFFVSENALVQTVVGEIEVNDGDENDQISLSILNANSVISISGLHELILETPLNYEARDSYTLTVLATDMEGLTDTASMYIFVNDEIETGLDLPVNKFLTPNGDGNNDYFVIDNVHIYGDYKLTVFNPAGAVIFTKGSNYDNTWDGTYNGAYLNDGTYYYIMQNNTDPTVYFKGAFTIIK